MKKKGAHDENHIQNEATSGIQSLEEIYGSLDSISIITVAPELPGLMETIPKLVERNITVSIGKLCLDKKVFLTCRVKVWC